MSEDDVILIATRVREAREFVGLSQVQVADALQIPRASVSEMEGGKRRISAVELKRLGELLRRPVSYFLGEDEHQAVEESDTMKAMFRTSRALSDEDAEQLLKFAEFLKNAGRRDKRKRTNKYEISVIGCDDQTTVSTFLTEEEADTIKTLSARINESSDGCCMPTMTIEVASDE